MSSSRDADLYESQNDQRLDELHAKIRTLRSVTTDIYDDAERQNLTLDETSDSFSSFGASLVQSSRRAAHSFGLHGGVKQWRIIMYCVGSLVALWFTWSLVGWWRGPNVH